MSDRVTKVEALKALSAMWKHAYERTKRHEIHLVIDDVIDVRNYIEQSSPVIETDAALSVLEERQRQKSVEGWSTEHDDEHDDGALAQAAVCYVADVRKYNRALPPEWPWDETAWKPTTHRRDLVKAGALILAEIERLDRATLKLGGSE